MIFAFSRFIAFWIEAEFLCFVYSSIDLFINIIVAFAVFTRITLLLAFWCKHGSILGRIGLFPCRVYIKIGHRGNISANTAKT